MPPTNPEELWIVTNVVDTTMFVPGQGAVAAKKVTFRTATGATSSVDVPDSEFDAETVGNLVHDAAVKIIDVQALKGPNLNLPTGPIVLDPSLYPNG